MSAVAVERAMPAVPGRWPLSMITRPAGALATAPAMARAQARDVLVAWGMSDMVDIAELVLSELVTNVVQAATDGDGNPVYFGGRLAEYQLGLFSDRFELLIQVFDHLPGMPVPKQADASDVHGRGLAIVDALTNGQWGSFPHPGGKVVWAKVADPAQSSPPTGPRSVSGQCRACVP